MSGIEEMVTFRLAPRDRAAIQRLIESGEFRNRSDFLRFAVKSALGEHEPGTKRANVDLEMEGVDLPASGSRSRSRTPSRKGSSL